MTSVNAKSAGPAFGLLSSALVLRLLLRCYARAMTTTDTTSTLQPPTKLSHDERYDTLRLISGDEACICF